MVDTVEGVRTGCAAAVSFMPEKAEHEMLLVMVEALRGVPEDAIQGTVSLS